MEALTTATDLAAKIETMHVAVTVAAMATQLQCFNDAAAKDEQTAVDNININ